MADIHFWERRFVECFVRKDKRDRYLTFLKSSKHRDKALDRLNHSLDYEAKLAHELPSGCTTPSGLVQALRTLHVSDTCYLMADAHALDGNELRVEQAADEFLSHPWGAALICPPRPIAVYKEEDPGRLILLVDDTQ